MQMTTTGPLEAAAPISKFIVILPADRKWFRHVYGLALTGWTCGTLSLLTFIIDGSDQAGRMMVPALLMAVLFLAKIAYLGTEVPQVLNIFKNFGIGGRGTIGAAWHSQEEEMESSCPFYALSG